MNKKDLKVGEIYVGMWKTDEKNMDLIFKFGGNLFEEVNDFISAQFNSNPRHFRSKASCLTGLNEYQLKFREATLEEKAWLNACIETNTFIPKDQIKLDRIVEDFQIY